MENNQLQRTDEKYLVHAKLLNNSVISVIGSKALIGFEKAYLVANALGELKQLLTPEYMKPIMALQGSRLGFKTDKDKSGGYSEEEVKMCLIDAVLSGFQPTGNQFNIIGGNMYGTREGFGAVLETIQGLKYNLTFKMPTVSADKSQANCIVKIDWRLGDGENNSQTIDFPIKSNAYASTDAILGKAERKARRWLFNKLNGTDVSDADVDDVDAKVTTITPTPTEITEQQIFSIEDHLEALKESKDKGVLKIKAEYKNYKTYQEGVSANNYLSGLNQ